MLTVIFVYIWFKLKQREMIEAVTQFLLEGTKNEINDRVNVAFALLTKTALESGLTMKEAKREAKTILNIIASV